MFYRKYLFGGLAAHYVETRVPAREGQTTIALAIYPEAVAFDPAITCDSMVQVAFMGDDSLVAYSMGVTMRNREATALRLVEQRQEENAVITRLTDGKGNEYVHTLNFHPQTSAFEIYISYENKTGSAQTLEHLSSFSLSGISAVKENFRNTAGLTLHRMTSAWSRECRLKSEEFSTLGLDGSWADNYGVKCERWGQMGSMPNRGYYPFAAIEEAGAGIALGVQLEAPSSWQLELYEEGNTCALSGGQGDFEFAHWRKQIPAGGSFTTHSAFIAVGKNLGEVCNALVHRADARLQLPQSEEDMHVLFNEYCTTWGTPSEEKIATLIEAVKDLGVKTFVIDAGWYKPKDRPWAQAAGDWQESDELFPHGMKDTAKAINAAGMNAGVWFEFECACRDSDLFRREELMLKRDGKTITARDHRFPDLRLPQVREYLEKRVLEFLQQNGFRYLKIDYNNAYGTGCDGAESLGEGGRQVAEESVNWLQRLKDGVSGLVIENCSSGGSRLEPYRMSKVSMCSFSDAHECPEIPLVAANVSRVIPARQIQIWAVLRRNESVSRTVYSLCAAMMGRICLSGDVGEIAKENRIALKEGLSFYEGIKDIVRYGDITKIDSTVRYYRKPEGRQVYCKEYGGRKLVIVHFLAAEETLNIPAEGRLSAAYTRLNYRAEGGVLTVEGKPYTAAAFVFKTAAGV